MKLIQAANHAIHVVLQGKKMPINNLLKCKNTTSRMFRNTTIFQFNCFKATIYKRLHRKLSNTAVPPYYHVENFLVNKVYLFFKIGLFKVSSLHIFHCLSHMWNGYDWLLRMLASQKPNHFQLKWQRYDNYIINHSCLFLGGSVIGSYSEIRLGRNFVSCMSTLLWFVDAWNATGMLIIANLRLSQCSECQNRIFWEFIPFIVMLE